MRNGRHPQGGLQRRSDHCYAPAGSSELFGLRREQVEAALAYYAELTDEIGAQVEANRRAVDEAEALWHRQQALLAG